MGGCFRKENAPPAQEECMPFQIIREDITRVKADAIVNTANPRPAAGRGTDFDVYRAAGYGQLLDARKKIGNIAPGEAAVTEAFQLQAKYLIHTVGPVWRGGEYHEKEILASCYRKSLLLAEQLGCESIVFPLISAGTYGFPKDLALETALGEFRSFLAEKEMEITLAVYDRSAYELSSALVGNVSAFIDDRYIGEKKQDFLAESNAGYEPFLSDSSIFPTDLDDKDQEFECINNFPAQAPSHRKPHREDVPVFGMPFPAAAAPEKPRAARKISLKDLITHTGDSFQTRLFRLIDRKKLTDAEVYKKANIDRKLFSKIRCNPEYLPKKKTAVALAMALELNMDETLDLLGRAGIALSDSSRFDLIITYCIENKIYDLFTVNAILFEYDQPLLGC